MLSSAPTLLPVRLSALGRGLLPPTLRGRTGVDVLCSHSISGWRFAPADAGVPLRDPGEREREWGRAVCARLAVMAFSVFICSFSTAIFASFRPYLVDSSRIHGLLDLVGSSCSLLGSGEYIFLIRINLEIMCSRFSPFIDSIFGRVPAELPPLDAFCAELGGLGVNGALSVLTSVIQGSSSAELESNRSRKSFCISRVFCSEF